MNIIKYVQKNYIDPILQATPSLINSIGNTAPVHTHDYYEFFLIIEGSCLHLVNGKEQYLDTGALVFIRPADVHSYTYFNRKDCRFINIPCSSLLIKDTLEFLGGSFDFSRLTGTEMPQVAMLPPIAVDNFITRFEKIMMLSSIDKSQARLNVMNLVVELFVQYFSNMQNGQEKKMPLWFEALLTVMQKKENYTLGLSNMQKLSGRSGGHLNRMFRMYLDTTPTEYINRLRLNYAKTLLLSTDLSGTEICFEAGFGNLSHFYHLFKKSFNLSPLDFREKSRARQA